MGFEYFNTIIITVSQYFVTGAIVNHVIINFIGLHLLTESQIIRSRPFGRDKLNFFQPVLYRIFE